MKIINLPHLLIEDRNSIYRKIETEIRSEFDQDVILTGIKDDSLNEIYGHQFTYGFRLNELGLNENNDLLDYALNTIVVYDHQELNKTANGDYSIPDPRKAVLGVLVLSW